MIPEYTYQILNDHGFVFNDPKPKSYNFKSCYMVGEVKLPYTDDHSIDEIKDHLINWNYDPQFGPFEDWEVFDVIPVSYYISNTKVCNFAVYKGKIDAAGVLIDQPVYCVSLTDLDGTYDPMTITLKTFISDLVGTKFAKLFNDDQFVGGGDENSILSL
jgi:hypothetical protein